MSKVCCLCVSVRFSFSIDCDSQCKWSSKTHVWVLFLVSFSCPSSSPSSSRVTCKQPTVSTCVSIHYYNRQLMTNFHIISICDPIYRQLQTLDSLSFTGQAAVAAAQAHSYELGSVSLCVCCVKQQQLPPAILSMYICFVLKIWFRCLDVTFVRPFDLFGFHTRNLYRVKMNCLTVSHRSAERTYLPRLTTKRPRQHKRRLS